MLLGHSTSEAGYLELLLLKEELRQAVLVAMADEQLDALVYATFDHPPTLIPADALTRTVIDSAGPGNNRRLSPALGFPAMTVPAGFTAEAYRSGSSSWGGDSRADAAQAGVRLRAGNASSQDRPQTTPAVRGTGRAR